jgi:protein-S-isoprenylcysteine O-methyltransferase Ste14
MFTRSVIAFLALPGMVAFAIPAAWLWYTKHTQLAQPLGLLLFAFGVIALLWCVRDFYVSGKGTLAPWAPPEKLVTVGLYRYSRNPMYVAVALMLLGWGVSFGSWGLFVYTFMVVIAFHLRVTFCEEPWLARTHGQEWQHYAARVPRWFW